MKPKAEYPILLKGSAVKRYLKESFDKACGPTFLAALETELRRLLRRAVKRSSANGRLTVKDRDV